MELGVVPFKWGHILVIVPALNDGNIYGTEERQFLGHAFAIFYQNISYKKGPDPFDPAATKYYELEDETICTGQPAVAALQRIKNQLPTRSGSAYKRRSL